jgi:hypothetical protein
MDLSVYIKMPCCGSNTAHPATTCCWVSERLMASQEGLGSMELVLILNSYFFHVALQPNFGPWPWNFSVSCRLLHLGQSAGLLERVISSSQGLCVSARVIVRMEKLVEWTVLTEETEVLGENPAPTPLCPQIPLATPGREPGPPRWEASD